MKTLTVTLLSLLALNAFAKKNCTNEPKEKRMSMEAFQKMVTDQGYKVTKYKQPGTCYEIYAYDTQGNKVEIYFNPVDGSVFKSKVLKAAH